MRRAQAHDLLMPAGTVKDHDSMGAWGDLCADLLQMLIHLLGLGGRHDDCRADTTRVADGAK